MYKEIFTQSHFDLHILFRKKYLLKSIKSIGICTQSTSKLCSDLNNDRASHRCMLLTQGCLFHEHHKSSIEYEDGLSTRAEDRVNVGPLLPYLFPVKGISYSCPHVAWAGG